MLIKLFNEKQLSRALIDKTIRDELDPIYDDMMDKIDVLKTATFELGESLEELIEETNERNLF